jgi:hypothetical protein
MVRFFSNFIKVTEKPVTLAIQAAYRANLSLVTGK